MTIPNCRIRVVESGERRRLAAATWAAALALPAFLVAQDWRGTGRAQGVVVDEERAPIAGARVALSFEATGSGPAAVSTDRRGRWTLPGLAPGRWKIAIESERFVRSEGSMDVPAGPAPPITVRLLPEQATVRGMLERGNALLASGGLVAAREIYETALGGLDRTDYPEVLRAIARTRYLERDLATAQEVLRQALLLAPGDVVTRELLVAVADESGRRRELDTWLAELAREGPERLLAASGGPLGWRPPETPLRDLASGPRGRFRTRFAERTALGAIETFSTRYGTPMETIAATDPRAAAPDLADETFELYVPESCSADAPCGLFVWISPGSWGGVTDREIVPELERRRLIWVGANRAGNSRLLWDRIALALDAAAKVATIYPVDTNRIWAGGYSGGGRTASALAVLYPELFRGCLCFMGVDFYRPVPIPSRPGAHWPAAFAQPPRAALDLVRERARLALVTGQFDFNRAQIEEYAERYRSEGFRHVNLVVLPELTHYDDFPAAAFVRGLDALEPAR